MHLFIYLFIFEAQFHVSQAGLETIYSLDPIISTFHVLGLQRYNTNAQFNVPNMLCEGWVCITSPNTTLKISKILLIWRWF